MIILQKIIDTVFTIGRNTIIKLLSFQIHVGAVIYTVCIVLAIVKTEVRPIIKVTPLLNIPASQMYSELCEIDRTPTISK